MTVGSLFAGIGGLELGLERAGMEVIWQVECEPYALQVLEKHWPDVRRYEDVRNVGQHNLERVDLICGGFPCQDISNAGNKAGIEGKKSSLWSEFARLICELRPRYALMENVSALLVRGHGTVLGDLAEIGYDAEWDCLPASAFGAPHRRDRIFILAYPEATPPAPVADAAGERIRARDIESFQYGQPEFKGSRNRGGICNGRGIGRRDNREKHSQASGRNRRQGKPRIFGPGSIAYSEAWETEPNMGRMAHGIPDGMDRLRCLGNAVVPQIAEWIGKRIMEYEARKDAGFQ